MLGMTILTREELSRLYRLAVETGEPTFTELRKTIISSSEVPMPWWVAAILPSVLDLEGGHPALMTPDEFERMPDGEAEHRRLMRNIGRRVWTPERQAQTDEAYRALMSLAIGTTNHDEGILRTVSSMALTASQFDPDYRFPVVSGARLETIIQRYENGCLPPDEKALHACSILRRVMDRWAKPTAGLGEA